jgi:hypothetical protein
MGTPEEELLADKACGPGGECLPGYVCDPGTNTCVPAGTPIGGTGGTSTGVGGSPTGTGGGTSTGGGTGGGTAGGGGSGGCTSVADCPAPPNSCQIAFCLGGECGTTAEPAGTEAAPSEQTDGDCQVLLCDGLGNSEPQNDDTDLPDDGSECTDDVCNSGTPSNPPLPLGTACGTSGTCDGAGSCTECQVPSDCTSLPPNDECQQRTCTSGACGQSFTAVNTPITAQTAGDCQSVVCDGSGSITSIDDDSDTPFDDNDCTDDVCTTGTPSNPPLADGTPCGTGGTFTCDGAGSCRGCTSPTDCQGTDTFCRTRTCESFTCGFDYTPQGTALPGADQILGNCLEEQCDGSGGVQGVPDATDVPADDGNECTDETCVSGSPQHPPLPLNTACTQGGSYCDGAGDCVECNSPDQCTNQGTVCQDATCDSNACGLEDVANGTPAPPAAQTPGDCVRLTCDGSGGTNDVTDPGDLPVDGNDCTDDVCTGQVPSNPPLPSGTPCVGGGTCDGSGNCSTAGANGYPCTTGTQCTSGFCVDRVCCESACGDLCEACSSPKTGMADGLCEEVIAGQDPDLECTGNDTCNGAGACAFQCGQDPDPPGGTCPSECTGGCLAGTCIIDCNSPNECTSQQLDCPAGFRCEVQCGGNNACGSATINCPDRYACEVLCTKGCASLAINCSTGVCAVSCSTASDCSSIALSCGVNGCVATCNGSDVVSANCGTSCACDDCLAADGEPCASAAACTNGYCPTADGVCCDTACDGTCEACLASKTGGTDGVCANIPDGDDPDDECLLSRICDGTGSCRSFRDGEPCSSGLQCESLNCPPQDDVCCDTACDGTCEACLASKTNGTDGTCAPIPQDDDPDDECLAADTCDGSGSCQLKENGDTCSAGTECQSGHCPADDGVCCDTDCNGPCRACTNADTGGNEGQCGNVSYGLDPTDDCTDPQVCDGTGSCVTP